MENADQAIMEPTSQNEVVEKNKKKSEEKNASKPRRVPRYRVVLWNDDDHTFQYVVTMMKKIFGYDKPRGMMIACGVHACGKTPVAVLPLEVAELRRDQIRQFGPDPLVEDCVASMFATIEPIDDDNSSE